MKLTFVFRIAAEICFYFSVLHAATLANAFTLPMALFAAACLLLGLVIVRINNPVIRGVLALLPGLCFLLAPFTWLLILPVFAWIYYILVMILGHYAIPLEEYRKAFIFMLSISLFFVAANIANSTLMRNQVISAESLAYALVFLILGIFVMRRLRMGAQMDMRWQVRNVLSVVGIPLLAIGASLAVFLLLRFSTYALGAILAPVGRFFIWLFHQLFPTGNSPIDEMTLEEAMQPFSVAQPVALEESGSVSEEMRAIEITNFNELLIERAAAVGGWILLGILLVIVLLLIWRHARKNEAKADEELMYEEYESAPVKGRKRRKNRLPLLAGSARQLRRIYKTYLEYRRDKGVAVYPSDTSAEVLEKDMQMAESKDAVRLRELYLAARYGNPSAVTREQVQEAQACLERIVS